MIDFNSIIVHNKHVVKHYCERYVLERRFPMKTRMIRIKKSGRTARLWTYFADQCHLAKNLQNTANFYIRNLRTGLLKEEVKRSANESEVIRITEASIRQYNQNRHLAFRKKAASIRKSLEEGNLSAMAAAVQVIGKLGKLKEMPCPDKEHRMLSYEQLNAVLYWSGNRDYFAMPSQVNQQVLRKVIKSWKGYFASVKAYQEDPKAFTGAPKIPRYKRTPYSTAHYTNQVIKLNRSGGKLSLSFPDRSLALCIGKEADCPDIVKVEVKPDHGEFMVLITYTAETAEPAVPEHPERLLGIDCGVDNFMAVLANFPSVPFLVDGRWIKSENQYFNKERSRLLSELTKGSNSTHSVKNSRRLDAISRKRDMKFRDFFYKTAYRIVRYAQALRIEVIVCTHNKGQKQGASIGDANNQNFIQIPFATFFAILRQVAAKSSIPVILREESYTSKASLVDRDPIPEYKKGDSQEYHFSGKRIKRGLYRTKDGLLINADLNGAGNVIRKEYPYAFDCITDWTYLSKTVDVITRAELCRAKKKSAGARPKKHRSYNRRSHHETHWDRKLGYMELFRDEKKKQPVKAA